MGSRHGLGSKEEIAGGRVSSGCEEEAKLAVGWREEDVQVRWGVSKGLAGNGECFLGAARQQLEASGFASSRQQPCLRECVRAMS